MTTAFYLEHIAFWEFTPTIEMLIEDGTLQDDEVAVAYPRGNSKMRGIYVVTTKDFVFDKYGRKLNQEETSMLRRNATDYKSSRFDFFGEFSLFLALQG